MHRLVALDLPGGAAFVDAMKRAHDERDAVLPVDQRLPGPAKERLYSALEPAIVVTEQGRQRRSSSPPVEEGDAFVVATSGTTGQPRGAVLTHEAIAASARASSERLGVDPTSDRWLCCLPLAHVGGLSVLTRAMHTNTAVEIHATFDAGRVAEAARGRGATLVSLVPTALSRLGKDASAFRTILLGGSAMPRLRPANTVASYGMTETASGVVYEGWPLEGVEVRIGDDDEIELRGPMLLRCYRGNGDPKDKDGWFRTGDAGRLTKDRQLEVFGRMSEVIRTGGEAVYPAPVETVLRSHPGIGEVAVVGMPDDEWGQRVVAFIEPAGDDSPSLDELRQLVGAELGPIFAPRELVIVTALPRTAIGKIRRDTLRSAMNEARA